MGAISHIVDDMKTISVSVSEDDYEVFRAAATGQGRPIAQLIRDAMAFYRQVKLEPRTRLDHLTIFHGRGPIGDLPSRAEIWEEIIDARNPPLP